MPDKAGQDIVRSLKEVVPSGKLRNPFTRLAEHISRGEALHIPDLAKPKDEIRIALISLPSPISIPPSARELRSRDTVDLCRHPDIDKRSCKRSLVWPRHEAANSLRNSYKAGLDYALSSMQADIVCINELGFPSHHARPLKSIRKYTRRLALEHNALILAGSCHDIRTLYNTSSLFYPNCPPAGVPYHKQVSAVSTGELISIPPTRSTILAAAFGLWVGVLICLDLADFSSVSAIVKFHEHCHLLLVPCFTQWTEELERIAHAASRAMPGIVALVNYHDDNSHPSYVFSRFGSLTQADSVDSIPGSTGSVSLFRVDRSEFFSEKTQRWIGASAEDRMEWLFGNRTQPLVLR